LISPKNRRKRSKLKARDRHWSATPRTQETFVLVRQDVYERVRAIIADINERADWDDPAFDVYERVESERRGLSPPA
jgi:hypothetical protein